MRVTLNTSYARTLRCAICNGRASRQASARVKPKRCVSTRRKVQQRVGEHRLLSGCECLLFSATSTRYSMGGTPDCREPSHPLSTLCMPVSMTLTECRGWLPAGKRAAVCFRVDDVHPATSEDEFDAGGDLGRGALGHVERLLHRHPRPRGTLFVTPDWRLGRPLPTPQGLSPIPPRRARLHRGPPTPRGPLPLAR